VEDLVRIGVADAAQQARIGERSLERVVLSRECGTKGIEIAGEDVDSTRIERT